MHGAKTEAQLRRTRQRRDDLEIEAAATDDPLYRLDAVDRLDVGQDGFEGLLGLDEGLLVVVGAPLAPPLPRDLVELDAIGDRRHRKRGAAARDEGGPRRRERLGLLRWEGKTLAVGRKEGRKEEERETRVSVSSRFDPCTVVARFDYGSSLSSPADSQTRRSRSRRRIVLRRIVLLGGMLFT